MRALDWRHIVLGSLLAGLASQAQSFPDHEDYVPLYCVGGPMTDLYRDQSTAVNEKDLVGNTESVAGLRASDGEFLYLRMRLDTDPFSGGDPRPFAWGVLINTDTNAAYYEYLVFLNGTSKLVALYRNTTTTLPNNPADPPDEPAVFTYPASTHARSIEAPEIGFGSNTDFFLDLALPWADLKQLGIEPWTPVVTWAATSSTSTTLNGDLACFDNAGGPSSLEAAASVRTVLDPHIDTDGDGFSDSMEYRDGSDPSNEGSRPAGTPDARKLAGGGGCSTTGLEGLWVLGLWALRRRTRV
jgi:hypothetical protein